MQNLAATVQHNKSQAQLIYARQLPKVLLVYPVQCNSTKQCPTSTTGPLALITKFYTGFWHHLSGTWTSVYKTKSTYNCSTDDTNVWQSIKYSPDVTNVWQSQTTTIPMTPTCGSHRQLQYRWHQCVAVTNNYNTDDTNTWQSRTTTIQWTPTCGSHRQLQYRWHQHVAVTNNYNTDDTNKCQSQTTY